MRRPATLAGILFVAATSAPAQDLKSELSLDKSEMRLSDSVRAKLVVEGSAPLRVSMPDKLLAAESDAIWKVRAVEAPIVSESGPGRQKWSTVVRLDPYVRGDAVKLSFAPFEVVAGSDPTPRPMAWPTQSLRVWTVASPADDVQVTGIEPLPLASTSEANWTLQVLAFSALALAALAIAIARCRRRRAPALSAGERVELELSRAGDGPAGAAAISDAIRGYVEAVYAIPATKLTTAELQSQVNGMPEEAAGILVTVLEACDSAKFAGVWADRAGLIEQARQFVSLAPPVTTG